MGKLEMHSTEKVYKACESSNNEYNNVKAIVAQSYATFVQCTFFCTIGMLFVMPTITIGALHNKANSDTSLTLDDSSASWIGSMMFMSHPLGSLTSAVLSETFGRRGAMMLTNVFYFLTWMLLYYATTVRGLCIAAAAIGVGIGFCEAPTTAYISEVNEPRLRGIFNCITAAIAILGNAIQFFIASVSDWRTSALISAVLPVISLTLYLTIPESPVWLIKKGRLEDAQKSLGWLRGFLEPHYVQREFDELVHYSKISSSLSQKSAHGTLDEKIPLDNENLENAVEEAAEGWFKERYKELKNPKLYLPLRMILIVFFFVLCASLMPFKSYFVEILQQFWFPFSSEQVLVMTGVMTTLGSVSAIFCVRLVGKRRLILVCMIINIISTLTLGLFASFFTHTQDMVLSWLLMIDLAIQHFVVGLGITSFPFYLIAEVYPIRGRGLAAGLSAAWPYFVNFVLTKTYLETQSIVGLSGMFYLYTLICVAGLIYIYLYVPETEGKTLALIETYFTPNHDRKEKFRMPTRKSSKV